MAVEDAYAAQIYCKGVNSGTGHLVRPDVILTARHVVCRPDGTRPPPRTQYEFRLWGDLCKEEKDGRWRRAEMIWDDQQLDVTLLRIVDPHQSDILRQAGNAGRSPLFGRLPPSDDRLKCLAFGWPKVLKTGGSWQAFPIWAEVSSRGHSVGEPILANAHDGPEAFESWKGYSGAAARVDDTLIGIVTKADPRFQNPVLHVLLLADIPREAAFWDHLRRPHLIDVGKAHDLPPKPPPDRRIVAIFAETDSLAAIMSHKPACSWIEETNRRRPKGVPQICLKTAEALLDGAARQPADLVVVFGRGAPEGLFLRMAPDTTTTLPWEHLARRIGDIAPDAEGVFLCVPDSSAASPVVADGVPLISVGNCPAEAPLRTFTIRLLEEVLRGSDVHQAFRSARAAAARTAGGEVPFQLSPGKLVSI